MRSAFVLYGVLYFGQGGLATYISYFQKPYLAGQGVSAASLGLLTILVSLPFAVKILFGLLIDRWVGGLLSQRVAWIFLGNIGAAGAFVCAALLHPADNLTAYTALIALMVFAVALADTATDAMAVDTVPQDEQADVQAVMTGSRAAGGIVASALVGLFVAQYGYGALMPAMAIIALIPLPFLFWAAKPHATVSRPRPPLTVFRRFFDRSRLTFILYALVMSLGFSGTIGLITLFMHSSLAAGSVAIGSYGVLVSGGTLVGAACYAVLRRRVTVKAATIIAQLLLVALALVLSVQHSAPAVTMLGLMVGIIYGFVLTGLLEMAMARSDLAFAGASFALLMSVFNFGGSIGDGVATAATGRFGFAMTFVMLAGISLIALVPLLVAHRYGRGSAGQTGGVEREEVLS